MTKDASFKKVVRRHAGETGQRYTEALTDLQGLSARMHHEPVPERLLAHLRDRYGIEPVAGRHGEPAHFADRIAERRQHRAVLGVLIAVSDQAIPRSAWRPTMRYRTSTAARSS